MTGHATKGEAGFASLRFTMSIRMPTVLLAAAFLSLSARADARDDHLRAYSRMPTSLTLCGDTDGSSVRTAVCQDKGYDRLIRAIDEAFDAALARTPANIKPLLKRDQVWFNEMVPGAVAIVEEMDDPELRDDVMAILRGRAATLREIGAGFGRRDIAGRWRNAFGTATLSPDGSGAFRLGVDINVNYGADKHGTCKLDILVTPSRDGWMSAILPAAATAGAASGNDDGAKTSEIKLRRQGDTLRIVLTDRSEWSGTAEDCDNPGQVTGTYFATGPSDRADKAEAPFIVPTFDCTRPDTATEEEICSDPDLAAHDQRLNRAWKALLPRLDETTRRALTEDQRHWLRTQTVQFPEFLHPAWEKGKSVMHYTADARDQVDGLQRERIALLEGFDDKRAGLAGVWLAHNAVLKVTVEQDGRLTARGRKWEQGDWKAGCEYDMNGRIVGRSFRSDERRANPDTLERDGAMLIVNRQDDVFATRRSGKATDDEPKCRRLDSSTVRLFPARPSADIDNLPGSIR
jgi:uncharacterized protein YecT (DUF1311 family)